MVVFLIGQIEFLRGEIKFNNFIERLLILKPVLHDKQPFSCNSKQITKINKHFTDKSVYTDDNSVGYHQLKQNNNMDIIIDELNKSLNSKEKSNETVNDKFATHPFTGPIESCHEISGGKYFDVTNSFQNIDFNISSGPRSIKPVENKSVSEINLDEPLFHEVADNAINQLIFLIENTNSLQAKRKELFTISKKQEPITSFSYVIDP